MVENFRYLGITISTKTSDLDLKRQMKKIHANPNLLLRKFSSCSVSVKCDLFKNFCSTLYCAPMWFDCTKMALKILKVAYDNSLRHFMKLPCLNSASEMFVDLNIRSFDEILRILHLDLCRELSFKKMSLYLIFTTHSVVCIEIFGLGGIVYYTQTELIFNQHTIQLHQLIFTIFLDVDIIYTLILLIVFIQCILCCNYI